MAKQLVTASLVAPAFLGLNTQESSVANNPSFALEANNCLIDQFGRLGARQGWFYRTSGSDGINLLGIHPFLDIAGSNTHISWNATGFTKGFSTLTTLTPTTTDTLLAGNWEGVTLNDRAYFFQEGYKPLYYTNESTNDEFKSIDQHADYTGTAPNASIVMSAYGRLWAANTANNKTTVYFSDLLEGTKWGTGSAGSINISAVLPRGSDVITGLGAHNGMLIVFCKNNTIIYEDTDSFQSSFNVSTIRLVEVLEGVGCIAKGSIQNTGEDMVFLSATGLRSLSRTIQEKSAKLNDMSSNVRDTFVETVGRENNLSLIKACYFPEEAFYIIHLPEAAQIYVFDMRRKLEDGSHRVTTWNNLNHANFVYDKTDKKMYLAQTNGIAQYGQYTDNGSPYTLSYFTNHFDFDLPNINKMIKRIAITAIGSTAQALNVKIGYDYSTLYYSFPFTIKEVPVSEYGIDEYGANAAVISEYVGGIALDRIDSSVSGAGGIVQVGVEATIDGGALSVQKLDVYGKQGRIV